MNARFFILFIASVLTTHAAELGDRNAKAKTEAEILFPPKLPVGQPVVTDTSGDFLKPPTTLRPEVTVAKTAPTIDFAFFPGQNYPGKPWSAWGDSVALEGKYY